MYILGIITGLILAVIAMLSVKRYETPIQRIKKQLENATKERGEVFVEDEGVEDLKAWADNLPKE